MSMYPRIVWATIRDGGDRVRLSEHEPNIHGLRQFRTDNQVQIYPEELTDVSPVVELDNLPEVTAEPDGQFVSADKTWFDRSLGADHWWNLARKYAAVARFLEQEHTNREQLLEQANEWLEEASTKGVFRSSSSVKKAFEAGARLTWPDGGE